MLETAATLRSLLGLRKVIFQYRQKTFIVLARDTTVLDLEHVFQAQTLQVMRVQDLGH